jgi:MFS superfamily sulfate permease-like transporter
MLTQLFPFLLWFRGYNRNALRADFLAGVTVALVLIPQSMAYAQLAGLPAYYGLYAAFLPPMVAALFGSSRQLGTGPVAVVSLMSAAALQPLAVAGSAEFIAYSIALAFIIGIFQLSLGILRLGMVVNFLSHPVINGFTNAAALIIASSQLPKFFGVYVDAAPHHYQTIIKVIQAACTYTHIPTLLYGLGAVGIMVLVKKMNPKIPVVLLAVSLTTLLSWATGFHRDLRVPVSLLRPLTVVETITAFNDRITTMQELTEQRTFLNKQLAEVRRTAREGIVLENALRLIHADIETVREEIEQLRGELRQLQFAKIQEGKGFALYLYHTLPSSIATDGIRWRLRVGNAALDPEALVFMGGGAIVGTIPDGLPSFQLPDIDFNTLIKLFPSALIISLLGFMEAIAIAKAMAAQTGQRLNPNQELIGQGLANIVGSFGSSYTVSGSFSRSAVNLQAGAVSGISSVITSCMVVLTLLFFTPLLYHLPQATLAAVIMMAVIGLINTKGFVHAWKAQKYDGIISVVTFFATLYFAPHLDKGILIGFALSMGVFLYKSMRPVVAELSLSQDHVLKNAEHHHLKGCRHISVLRFDGALFFANAGYLDEQVTHFRVKHPELRYILLDARGINDIDASGEEVLARIVERLRAAGVGFAMSSVKGQVMQVIKRTHLLGTLGQENVYPDTRTAVAALIQKVHQDTSIAQKDCAHCPLTEYVPEPR